MFSCKILYFVLPLFALLLLAESNFVPDSSLSDLSLPPHICKLASDPDACLTIISEATVSDGVTLDVITLLQNSLMRYVHDIDRTKQVANKLKSGINDPYEKVALADCVELMDISVDLVTESVVALANWTSLSRASAQAWLGGVLTNHVTCLDGLHVVGKSLLLGTPLEELILKARSYLAIVAAIFSPPSSGEEDIVGPLKGKLPSWIAPRDRNLLESAGKDIKANVVVAQDGSGNYKTVTEAVASAPDKGKDRYVIHVKKGTYKEQVEVGKKKTNVMIVGDGMDLTIITGSLNFVDGSTTFRSATLAAVGNGFILQDVCIQNSAGPEKHQAVALRVGADQSVINRCRLDAYQDTLYTHSLRQFYRDCYVTGTVDFIFGNSAVVFQKCQLVAQKPMAKQKNMITAQGRTDINQNTGISIQQCDVIASPDLEVELETSTIKTYLGRPWKLYSRTVVMQSNIGAHIDPAGWAEWDGDFALDTLYYGEYMNRGGGAGTSKRVNWPGYHLLTDPSEAINFTVAQLIQGGEWLKSTGVAFIEGL